MDEQILLLLLVMTRRYFFEKIREIKTEEKMMKNKEKTLLILQLHTKKNITTCAPVQLQNELRKKQQKIKKNSPQQP